MQTQETRMQRGLHGRREVGTCHADRMRRSQGRGPLWVNTPPSGCWEPSPEAQGRASPWICSGCLELPPQGRVGGELWHRERVPVEAHSAAGGPEDRGRGRRGPRPVGPEVNDGRRERKGWVEGVELAGEAEAEGQLRPPPGPPQWCLICGPAGKPGVGLEGSGPAVMVGLLMQEQERVGEGRPPGRPPRVTSSSVGKVHL